MLKTQTFSSLKSEQFEAAGLLQVGTFLEYFDLMLYIHMSVLLNELFFPLTDPHTTQLLLALSFCMTFVLRPFGALLFGYIGDQRGRKVTVVITTVMMALTCLTMFVLPTYAQIGIAASWIMLACRAVQGVSSVGEVVGAGLYLMESVRRPAVYPVVGLVAVSATLGSVVALVIASLATSYNFSWRYAFLAGASIAIVGAIARTRLRETPEFVDAKQRLKTALERAKRDRHKLAKDIIIEQRVSKIAPLAYFLIGCPYPACFYVVYSYCAFILKDTFHYTTMQVIHQNLSIALIELISVIGLTWLSYRVFPLKILRVRLIILIGVIVTCPYLLAHAGTPGELFLIQAAIIVFGVSDFPATPIFYRHFPIFKRFTYAGLSFALSRALVYVATSFGLVYLTPHFGHSGLLIIMIPILLGCAFGLYYFIQLEKKTGNTPEKMPLLVQ